MFIESIPTQATPAATSASAEAALRCGCDCAVAFCAEVLRVVGADEDGVPREALELCRGELDRLDAATVEDDGGEPGHLLEGQLGEVVAVGVAMERDVDVRAGVRADLDHPDVERRPGGVDRLGRLAREVGADHRRRQARVGRHPVGDDVAEVDEPCRPVPGLSRVPGFRTRRQVPRA